MIISVLGTMIYTFFLKAFSESVIPITRLRASAALHKVMANITADCNRFPKWRSGTVYTYSAIQATYVIPSNFNGYYYILANTGTSSAGLEPIWPLSSGGTYIDNGIIWAWGGRLRALKPLATLQSQIGAEGSDQNANYYGKSPDGTYTKYTVVKNRFIQFDASGNEIDDTTAKNYILKVTLKNETGETLTSLFFSDWSS